MKKLKKLSKFKRWLLLLVARLMNPRHKGGFALVQGYDPAKRTHKHVVVKKDLR